MLGICRNLALDRVRQRERRDALWQLYGAELVSARRRPPRSDELSYEVIHLEDCLSQLPQRSRDVVRLAYAEARSADEIAGAARHQPLSTRACCAIARCTRLRSCMSKRISWEALS